MSEDKKLIPKRRFKEFENAGAWEQRRLEKIAAYSKGRGYSKKDIIKYGTPVIMYGSLYTDYRLSISDINTFVEGKKNSVYSIGREVIVPSSGETSEEIARASSIIKPGIIIAGDLNIIYPNTELDPTFLALSLSYGISHRELSRKAQGKSVVHIHNSDIKELKIMMPSLSEQSKIKKFFLESDKRCV